MFPYLNGVVERAQTYFAHKYHIILAPLGLTHPSVKWELQCLPQKALMCIKGHCLWREFITVPNTGKSLVINSSLTLMLKVGELLRRKSKFSYYHNSGGFLFL